MRWRDVPLPDGSYADDSRPYSSQDIVNWIPEFAEQSGGRSRMKLVGVPGLQEFAIVGEGPIRGMRDVEGKRFVVSGDKLYSVSKLGGSAVLGTIPGRSHVSMTHNQIAGGNEVVIATGADAYVWNTVTETFAKITDAGFPGARIVDFIGQLIVYLEPQKRYFGNSDLADATSYSALETYESESCPDRLVSLRVSHGEVLVLNERTIEVFAYTGETNALFQNKGIVIERGCGAAHSVVNIDNTVMLVGNDGSWYRLNGYNVQRVSTIPVENAVSTCTTSKAFAMVWEDRGHKVVYFTYPDGKTWGYDCATGKIHRRESKDMERWRVNALVKWDGDWYGGDFQTGMIYKLAWNYQAEGSDELVRYVVTPVLHADQNRAFVHGIQAKFDTGLECEAATVATVPLTLTGTLANGAVAVAYSSSLTVGEGVPPYSGHAVVAGSLPAGVALTTTTGATVTFAGTPS